MFKVGEVIEYTGPTSFPGGLLKELKPVGSKHIVRAVNFNSGNHPIIKVDAYPSFLGERIFRRIRKKVVRPVIPETVMKGGRRV